MLSVLGYALLAVVVVVVILVVLVVSNQKKLVHADELCGNALSQIGVQQASRWDALNALADIAKSYSDTEYKTIMDTIAARQGVGPKSSAADVQSQEAMLQKATAQVNALAEAYPDLKSNTLYAEQMRAVRDFENKVSTSRMVYNDTVTKFNRMVRQLPSSLIAGMLGYHVRDYLETDDTKASMPSMAR